MARLNFETFPELSPNTLVQLNNKKIYTVFDFIHESNENLVKFTDLPFKDIVGIRKRIYETYGGITKKASELLINNYIIATGIKTLDSLLNGGLYVANMYEICGVPSSGKSQFCHTIASNIAVNSLHEVHYIDTKGDFCATKVFTLLQSKKYADEEILRAMKSMKVSSVTNINELLTLLYHLSHLRKSQMNCSSTLLLIIDSLPALFLKSPYDNNITIVLNNLANICKFITKQCRAIIVTVNMTTQWREIDGLVLNSRENPIVVKPSLGKYWSRVPDTRLLIENLNNGKRKMTIWRSTRLKLDANCQLNITNEGVI